LKYIFVQSNSAMYEQKNLDIHLSFIYLFIDDSK